MLGHCDDRAMIINQARKIAIDMIQRALFKGVNPKFLHYTPAPLSGDRIVSAPMRSVPAVSVRWTDLQDVIQPRQEPDNDGGV